MKIAIQGEPGSFSEEAALNLQPQAKIDCCPSFREVFTHLADHVVDRALIPIENTLAGSVTENYDLLREHNAFIQAETQLRIEHNLIIHPESSAKQIRRVLSHPVALQQCRAFLRKHPNWDVVPFYDTAGSVKEIMANGWRDAAGVASRRAASVYGARILQQGIEDNKKNYTRFFLLGRTEKRPAQADKVSLAFTIRNQPGALFKCLSVFALRDLNLTRIESRPVPGRPWEYCFYVDFMGNPQQAATRNALRHLDEITDLVKVLGVYPSAQSAESRAESQKSAKPLA